MATFVILRHPFTILVTDLTNPNNLANAILILNFLKNDCDTWSKVTKNKWDNKIKQVFYIFNTKELFSKKELT